MVLTIFSSLQERESNKADSLNLDFPNLNFINAYLHKHKPSIFSLSLLYNSNFISYNTYEDYCVCRALIKVTKPNSHTTELNFFSYVDYRELKRVENV